MLICIGGVCVPYTAVIPIAILALKWLAEKLYTYGLIPDFIARKAALTKAAPSVTNNPLPAKNGEHRVKTLQSEEEFTKSIQESRTVVVKFTATWCKPCHRIQPFLENLSIGYQETKFWLVDVDDFDDLASKYEVAMMPTFVVFENAMVKGKYSGSNENQLSAFLMENLN